MIHVEGMGILGSILARRLAGAGVEFTWSDNDSPITAWRASTSTVVPSGDANDVEGYERWLDWAEEETFGGLCELSDYVFTQRRPPHGARYGFLQVSDAFRRLDAPAVNLNAQRLVEATRAAHAERRAHPTPGSRVVVCHGFNERLDRYVWGWSAAARLTLPDELGPRPTIYDRRPRVKGDPLSGLMSYAYPQAGVPGRWLIGSSMIQQKHARELDVAKHLARWQQAMNDLGVGVAEISEPIHGWRPAAAKDDTAWAREIAGRLVVRPMSHSGVKHAPQLTDAVMEALGVAHADSPTNATERNTA